jgi:hypothetical protein
MKYGINVTSKPWGPCPIRGKENKPITYDTRREAETALERWRDTQKRHHRGAITFELQEYP